nr:hypothetical protein [Bacteroidales bacterium]
SLLLRFDGKRSNYQIPSYPVLVYRHGSSELVHTQQIGEAHNYLSGSYDIEVLTSPTLRLNDVAIVGSSATDLSIPTPGLANISKPKTVLTGTIFALHEGKLTYVCDLNPNKVNERILLMPGQYMLVVKPQSSIQYKAVRTKRFQIEASQTTQLNLGE